METMNNFIKMYWAIGFVVVFVIVFSALWVWAANYEDEKDF